MDYYCLCITAESSDSVWKRIIKHHDLSYDTGIDARSLINIFRNSSDIVSVLGYTNNKIKDDKDNNLYLVVNNEYTITIPHIK